MSRSYYIKEKSNQLIATDESEGQLTSIEYDRGRWKIISINNLEIKVNGSFINSDTFLNKYDVIEINSKKMNWSNYLYEGNSQELYLRDFIRPDGRISKSNYRVLPLLFIGLIPCIFFLPELIIAMTYTGRRSGHSPTSEQVDLVVKNIAPTIWLILGSLLAYVFLNITIKRMRDTGYPIWKLLIPIENLRILFTEDSKQ